MRIGSTTLTVDQLVITLLFCAETFSRGLLLAIIPLDLLVHLGSTQRVTIFYAAATFFGLGNSLLVPFLLNTFGIRALVASAACLMICAAALFASESVLGLGLGMIVRIVSSACIEIPMLAFMMTRIRRDRLGAFEPIRVFFQGGCLAISAWLGFALREHVHPLSPYVLAGVGGVLVFCAAMIALPRASEGAVIVTVPRHPGETIHHFFRQPRLRLAWFLSLTRSSQWVVFYVYAPLFAVTCGWSPESGAAFLSLCTAMLLLVPFWGILARRFGIRRLLTAGYALAGLFLLVTAAAAFWAPEIAPFFLLGAALLISSVEGAGNVPFLRATRPLERAAMAGIYMTYRDVSQFAPLALFTVILAASQLASGFVVSACFLFGAARLSQSIHPRLR
jgi:hypothetical protein